MNRNSCKMLLLVLLSCAVTQASAITRDRLAAYAASLKGLRQSALKTAVYNLCQPDQVLSYGSGTSATWYGFWYTDRINTTTNECFNRYSSAKFYFTSHDGKAISGMNIEHSFPKSWWGGSSNMAYKDLFNLYPSDSQANNAKSNYPMGVVTTVKTSSGDGYDKVGTGYIDGIGTINLWEPGDLFKGEFARSYMYMATVYQNFTWKGTQGLQELENDSWPTLREWAYTLYLEWSRLDPVDLIEVNRNQAVADLQGNRNLFIDFPYLCEYVWGDSVDVAFDPTTAITTASDDDRYTGEFFPSDDDDDNGDDNGDEDDEAFRFAKVTAATDGMRCLIVARYSGSLQAASPVKSGYKYGYLYTRKVTAADDVIRLDTDSLAFTFEATAGGYYIADSHGRYYYQDGSYRTFTPTTSRSLADIWSVTLNSDGETFTIRAADSGQFIQYSTGHNSWGNYDSAQSDGLYPLLYALQTVSDAIRPVFPEDAILSAEEPSYDLSGRPLPDSAFPGIHIRGGRKYLVR